MNRLSTADRSRVIACLVEGNSQRATTRMTGVAKKTVARLAVELGEACERFADAAVALGKLGAGKPKRISPEESARRVVRAAVARAKLAEKRTAER